MEIKSDLKEWYAISCPTTGLRFDARTLELLDANRDGNIRTEEVQAALAFLKEHGVEPEQLAEPDPDGEAKLADVMKRIAELDKAEPSEADKKALADWEAESLPYTINAVSRDSTHTHTHTHTHTQPVKKINY